MPRGICLAFWSMRVQLGAGMGGYICGRTGGNPGWLVDIQIQPPRGGVVGRPGLSLEPPKSARV
jgi:hypothetical protein